MSHPQTSPQTTPPPSPPSTPPPSSSIAPNPLHPASLPVTIPHLSNVKNFIPLELSYENFYTWKRIFHVFLDSHEVLGVVDGSIPCPPSDDPQFKIWHKCDTVAHSWINASLSLPVLETLLNYDCPTAHSAWVTLEKLFLDHASSTQQHLRRKFQNFSLGNLRMADYLQQIHSIFCSLRAVGEDLKEHDLVAQTLLGLPLPEFSAFQTVINASTPRPNFAALRPLLLSEADRVLKTTPPNSSNLVLYSNQAAVRSSSFSKPSNYHN